MGAIDCSPHAEECRGEGAGRIQLHFKTRKMDQAPAELACGQSCSSWGAALMGALCPGPFPRRGAPSFLETTQQRGVVGSPFEQGDREVQPAPAPSSSLHSVGKTHLSGLTSH